jgi:LysM repeat protein
MFKELTQLIASSGENRSMSYQIKSGDTLSKIASKYGTSVSALMQANPQIKNANLIYAGASLKIPGRADDFQPQAPRGSGNASPSNPVSTPGSSAPAGQSAAFDEARKYLNWNAKDLKTSGNKVGLAMEDWVPNNVNCANFVSGCLQASGQITRAQHNNSVMGLMANLDRDSNFKRVSLQDAKPGDVVSMKTAHGQHVVMFAGWENGKPMFIGSNNINPDGSQRISVRQMNYPIMAIHQYQG